MDIYTQITQGIAISETKPAKQLRNLIQYFLKVSYFRCIYNILFYIGDISLLYLQKQYYTIVI